MPARTTAHTGGGMARGGVICLVAKPSGAQELAASGATLPAAGGGLNRAGAAGPAPPGPTASSARGGRVADAASDAAAAARDHARRGVEGLPPRQAPACMVGGVTCIGWAGAGAVKVRPWGRPWCASALLCRAAVTRRCFPMPGPCSPARRWQPPSCWALCHPLPALPPLQEYASYACDIDKMSAYTAKGSPPLLVGCSEHLRATLPQGGAALLPATMNAHIRRLCSPPSVHAGRGGPRCGGRAQPALGRSSSSRRRSRRC